MPSYSLTQAAILLSAGGDLGTRVQCALLKYAQSRSAAAVAAEAAYVRRLAGNPAGEANAVVPILIPLIDVDSPGTDSSPIAPTDAELTAGIAAIWSFLTG